MRLFDWSGESDPRTRGFSDRPASGSLKIHRASRRALLVARQVQRGHGQTIESVVHCASLERRSTLTSAMLKPEKGDSNTKSSVDGKPSLRPDGSCRQTQAEPGYVPCSTNRRTSGRSNHHQHVRRGGPLWPFYLGFRHTLKQLCCWTFARPNCSPTIEGQNVCQRLV